MGSVSLHYERLSTGGDVASTVVLMHGVGDSLEAWDDVIRSLPEGFDVIRYDLRGHGRSDKPPGPYLLADVVKDHLALLAQLGVDRVNVVGYSLGGLIAQAIALLAPNSVERLVLISCVAGRTSDEQAAALERLDTLERAGTDGIADASAERWFTEGFRTAHPGKVHEQLERLKTNDPDAYLAAYRMLATNDLGDQLDKIEHPTLVMTGEHDVGSPPRMARLISERIEGSRSVILEGQKHSVLTEVPEMVADEISRFLLGPQTHRTLMEVTR
ncbi:MAG: (E)-2-((N-methylformamido)methylene)succinate hydrolase [Actinomycetota bacterium]|nr:(E)-2-((N-methylformamido)methylene)succinate hydrolase [Actinomycetota bacterium]